MNDIPILSILIWLPIIAGILMFFISDFLIGLMHSESLSLLITFMTNIIKKIKYFLKV